MKTIRCRPKNLKFDSKMPCLVQLIQDDSPMGYCNRDLFGYDPNNFEPFICHGIVDENDKTDASRGAVIRDEGISGQWYRYEIVGKIAK